MKGTLKVNDLLGDAEALCKYAGDAGVQCCAEVPQPSKRIFDAFDYYRATAAKRAQ